MLICNTVLEQSSCAWLHRDTTLRNVLDQPIIGIWRQSELRSITAKAESGQIWSRYFPRLFLVNFSYAFLICFRTWCHVMRRINGALFGTGQTYNLVHFIDLVSSYWPGIILLTWYHFIWHINTVYWPVQRKTHKTVSFGAKQLILIFKSATT